MRMPETNLALQRELTTCIHEFSTGPKDPEIMGIEASCFYHEQIEQLQLQIEAEQLYGVFAIIKLIINNKC